jgi:hypothetical protein
LFTHHVPALAAATLAARPLAPSVRRDIAKGEDNLPFLTAGDILRALHILRC